jgi:DNA transposition AAA+ family ATPase
MTDRTAPDIVAEALRESSISLDLPTATTPTPPPAPTIHATPAVRLVVNRIAYAVKRRSPLCVVAGEHGAGKTTAATLYAQSNPRALYWQVPPEYNAREVVADLCERLGIRAGEAWRVRTSVLTTHLREHPHVILLDEAQRMDYRVLDMVKYIADHAGITVVLLGSPWLDRVIDRHTDIASRAWVRVRVQPIELEAFRLLYSPLGYNAKTLKAAHEVTRGVMRSITALFEHLDEGLRGSPGMTRADLTPDHVRGVADEVLS